MISVRSDAHGADARDTAADGAPDAAVGWAREHREFGRYRLRFLMAEGGMGAVYLARYAGASGFARWVALKIARAGLGADARFVAMFLDEARLVARIHHPNVCAVLDSGAVGASHYFAMEYLHGESLAELLRAAWAGDGLPLEVAARIVADAAHGLHAAHELSSGDGASAGVVHRDVSPHNVMVLYEGVAKVVDFGVARSRERVADATEAGEIRGKLAYLAPEQVTGAPVDRRTDVFALGIVLWEATLGARLFAGGHGAQVMHAVLHAPVRAPREVDPHYPPGLEQIVMRALERDPALRWQTAQDMARALERCLGDELPACPPSRVADVMRELFAERIAAREALLARESQAIDATVPAIALPPDEPRSGDDDDGDVDVDVDVVAAAAEPPRTASRHDDLVGADGVAAVRAASRAAEQGPARPRSRVVVVGAALAAMCLGAGFASARWLARDAPRGAAAAVHAPGVGAARPVERALPAPVPAAHAAVAAPLPRAARAPAAPTAAGSHRASGRASAAQRPRARARAGEPRFMTSYDQLPAGSR